MHVKICVMNQNADKVIDEAIDGYVRASLEESGPHTLKKRYKCNAFFLYDPSCEHSNLTEFSARVLPVNL